MVIESASQSAAEIFHSLDRVSLAESGARVEIRRPALSFRAVDPAVLVATIGAVGSCLTALMTGLLQISSTRKAQRLTVELASGNRVEVPADIPPEELRALVEALNETPQRIILP
ncbi:hypothetical protein ABZ490_26445 [Streptomyces sp. NPDC005811]|uniref:hypothetical protein n=1 Tax=Streptomyces sp. NPDC005811 TaxID=3154565 RepID=UPI0033F03BA1